MLCVPVASESRTLVKADLLNASRAADIIELCLDRFTHRPDVAELLATVRKPVIVSCRRRREGGHWRHSEDQRIEQLRDALAAEPAFIELELDIAAQFPRSSKTKRLVSINSPFRALTGLPDLLRKAVDAGADVVKIVWPGVLLDSLQPVLAELLQGSPIPLVGIPIGHAACAFAVLARKCGAPWVYAALERGGETHDGLPLVRELDELYRIRAVDHETRLVGVVGFGTVRDRTLRVFNAACQDLALNLRCLPLEIGPVDSLRAQLDQLHISAIMVTPGLGDYLLPVVEVPEPAVAFGQHVDLLLRKKDGWHGYNVLWRSALRMLERTLKRQGPAPRDLQDTQNVILGCGRIARSLLFGLRQLKATAVLSSPQVSDEVSFCPHCGEALSAPLSPVEGDVRHVPFADVATLRPDVLIATEPGLELGFRPNTLNPLILQPEMVVVDVTSLAHDSDLIIEARDRGSFVVRSAYIFAEHLATQFKAVTQVDLPDRAFRDVLGFEE